MSVEPERRATVVTSQIGEQAVHRDQVARLAVLDVQRRSTRRLMLFSEAKLRMTKCTSVSDCGAHGVVEECASSALPQTAARERAPLIDRCGWHFGDAFTRHHLDPS
uniref:Uncharacterized protein n=1 Tax=Parascaris univalens TaxID=6257 RepID=A0A915A8S6_PARUN